MATLNVDRTAMDSSNSPAKIVYVTTVGFTPFLSIAVEARLEATLAAQIAGTNRALAAMKAASLSAELLVHFAASFSAELFVHL